MTNKTTVKTVREKLNPESCSLKDGVFTIRRGFFYRGGFTADAYAERVKTAFPNATILESGEVWKDFKGGASVANSSHWFVKFSVE